MNKHIGILGCGWLGYPLAQALSKKSYQVSGTTTSEEKLNLLEDNGISPYLVSLSETGIHGNISEFLSSIDILVVNVPPRLRGGNKENFVAKMEWLRDSLRVNGISKLIFVSSTSVYGDLVGEVTETSQPNPVTESGKQLLQSEKMFREDPSLATTVLRFGGLIGPARNPVTMLSNRKGLRNGDDPINLIHLDDCIHMITTIIEREYWGEIFNGVYPHHPSKKEYYTHQAQKLGIPAPVYLDAPDKKPGKIVKSRNFLDKSHSFYTPVDE